MAAHTTTAQFSGPSHRESFFDAQRRNRHATWRLSAVCVFASFVIGIPLALTITPLLYAAALLVAEIINIWAPLPASFWHSADQFARYGIVALGWLTGNRAANPQAVALGAIVLLLPGAILSVGMWLGINALFRRAGVGGALLALKAREPNSAELRELRLSDVVQEMAIAAGLPAPKLMLIDSEVANAAAIGTSPNDARIVVTRGLIEQLNRDELQGALAHLVALIGNGDLRIAFRVTSVFETYGLLLALINAPFGSQSRRTLWRVVRYALVRKKTGDENAEEAATVADFLTRGTELEADDIDRFFDTSAKKRSPIRAIRATRNFLLFPIFFTNFAIKLSLWFFSLTLLDPSVALLWRKRVYLADASAIQLTRNPDGLAEALRKLNAQSQPIPGGAWAAHLFLVNPSGSDRMNDPKAKAQQEQILARIWAASQSSQAADSSTANVPTARFAMDQILATGRGAMAGDQAAMARMVAFRQAAATALGKDVEELPSVQDVIAAQQGEIAAMQHLAEFSNKIKANESNNTDSQGPSGGLAGGFGFHPSLKRRLKRLDQMGAHVELERSDRKTWIVVAVLSLLLGPLALLAVALMLFLIAVLVLASLTFLAIWMAFIHQLFVVFVHH